MIKLGIECENLEDAKSRWGIGHMVLNLLKEYEANETWQKEFKLYLYFNRSVPSDEVLKNPIFTKRIVGWKHFNSFNIFYHILMPLRALRDQLDYMFFPAYMLPPLYFRKSIVVLTNDAYYEYTQGVLPFKYRLAYGIFTNWAALFATKILAISEACKKEVVKLYGIKPNKIFVSRLGTRLSHVGEVVEKKNYILYVGQMFPRRHAKETILAFDSIAREFPGLGLILVGKDKYLLPTIGNLIREVNTRHHREIIIWQEYLEDYNEILQLYRQAQLLIYVSDHEAFGLPPVEAASLGTPVVVMENELNHELFGHSAFFANNGSAEAIANAIRAGLTNAELRGKFVENYRKIIPKLSWYNFAKNFFENVK